ncbi:MAG TPA: GAF domain-containing protein [Myxococcota bacterium]|nr:GAF domain-containing protein [Myxococcota bacterium]
MSADAAPDALRAYEAARLRLARMRIQGGSALSSKLAEIAETAADTLCVERVGIWLLIDGGRGLRCYHLYDRPRKLRCEGAVLHVCDFPAYFRALEERRSIPASDAHGDPATQELGPAYLTPLGIVSMLDAPIYREGRVVGVVCHESAAARIWTAQERDFAASVADRVGAAFEEAARRDAENRLRELENAAVEANKMEALGRLAAGRPLDRWGSLWEKVARLAAAVDGLNLDRRQALLHMLTLLALASEEDRRAGAGLGDPDGFG